ncbi:hypothetical protein CYMTET_27127 [Cymbomonas tetramitiformis]|uniref:Uncharacterized protein n=1 Tax=Cymbomonas tetramitiformis TaxID=36881 RepID=A0AAE0KXH0_9CHLO|nr:hypothetical protein CYMTET_27127 [Cymbomonas tetramitiformis]
MREEVMAARFVELKIMDDVKEATRRRLEEEHSEQCSDGEWESSPLSGTSEYRMRSKSSKSGDTREGTPASKKRVAVGPPSMEAVPSDADPLFQELLSFTVEGSDDAAAPPRSAAAPAAAEELSSVVADREALRKQAEQSNSQMVALRQSLFDVAEELAETKTQLQERALDAASAASPPSPAHRRSSLIAAGAPTPAAANRRRVSTGSISAQALEHGAEAARPARAAAQAAVPLASPRLPYTPIAALLGSEVSSEESTTAPGRSGPPPSEPPASKSSPAPAGGEAGEPRTVRGSSASALIGPSSPSARIGRIVQSPPPTDLLYSNMAADASANDYPSQPDNHTTPTTTATAHNLSNTWDTTAGAGDQFHPGSRASHDSTNRRVGAVEAPQSPAAHTAPRQSRRRASETGPRGGAARERGVRAGGAGLSGGASSRQRSSMIEGSRTRAQSEPPLQDFCYAVLGSPMAPKQPHHSDPPLHSHATPLPIGSHASPAPTATGASERRTAELYEPAPESPSGASSGESSGSARRIPTKRRAVASPPPIPRILLEAAAEGEPAARGSPERQEAGPHQPGSPSVAGGTDALLQQLADEHTSGDAKSKKLAPKSRRASEKRRVSFATPEGDAAASSEAAGIPSIRTSDPHRGSPVCEQEPMYAESPMSNVSDTIPPPDGEMAELTPEPVTEVDFRTSAAAASTAEAAPPQPQVIDGSASSTAEGTRHIIDGGADEVGGVSSVAVEDEKEQIIEKKRKNSAPGASPEALLSASLISREIRTSKIAQRQDPGGKQATMGIGASPYLQVGTTRKMDMAKLLEAMDDDQDDDSDSDFD